MQAPAFTKKAIVGSIFTEISLEEFQGKWVVLVFVPLAFTFVCPTEIIALDKALGKFENRNAEVLVASTDSEYTLMAWNKAPRTAGGLGGVNLPLLADKNHSLARDYGVLVEEEGIALRGTVLVNPEGNIVYKSVNDTPVGRSLDEILRVLDAFVFVEEQAK